MPVAPSFQDLLDVGMAEAAARRPDLTFADGDISLAMLHAGAAMSEAVLQYAAQGIRDTYFSGARGDALTVAVEDKLALTRAAASSAIGSVRFTRPTTAGGAGTIAEGTQVATTYDSSGARQVYETVAAVSVGGGDLYVNAQVQAVAAGTSGNVAIGKVTTIVDQLFDASFTVTNPAALAGGATEESDEAYRARAAAWWQTQRRATLAALEQGALEVDGVRTAVAVEDAANAYVALYIADENGDCSAELLQNVRANLENWRAAGIDVQVFASQAATLTLAIQIDEWADGFSPEAGAVAIADSVTTRINKLGSRSIMRLDSIVAAVIAPFPDEIYDVSFTLIELDGTTFWNTSTPTAPQDIDAAWVGKKFLQPGTITVTRKP